MTLSAADFAYIRELVRRRSAIALDGKEYLAEARLPPVARAAGADSLAALVSLLRRSPEGDLHLQAVEALTTNETSWFRDRHCFEAFESVLLPDLLRRRAGQRRLTVWSAAASSGQEAYSIAMLVQEQLAGGPSWDVRVLATDLSTRMVARTQAGVYSQLEVNRGLAATRLVRYFSRAGTGWQVDASLRALVSAAALNLAAPFPVLPAVDVVFLRNVLIYFPVAEQAAVLGRVRRVLRPDGYLLLGSAETTAAAAEGFERVPLERATAYRVRAGQVAA